MAWIETALGAEFAVIAVCWCLYGLVSRKDLTKRPFVVAKMALAFRLIALPYAGTGLALSLLTLLISLFRRGLQAELLQEVTPLPFIILSGVGIAHGVWACLRWKAPPTETEYAAGEKAAEAAADRQTGWPVRPMFVYRGQRANQIVTGGLGTAMCLFLVSIGGATLTAVWLPGFLPESTELRLIRTAADGPVTDGILLLILGLAGLLWLAVLMRVAGRRLRGKRPVAITERGIYAFARGGPLTFLPWTGVRSVSELRNAEDRPLKPSIELQIESADGALSIFSDIRDFGRVCQLISRYAGSHAIDLRLVDRRRDTLKAQRGKLARTDYRKLLHTGVVSRIAEL